MSKLNKILIPIFVALFLAGLGLMLYPTVSNLLNMRNQADVISDYSSEVDSMDEAEKQECLEAARGYNRKICFGQPFKMTDEDREEYNSLLNPDGSGVMGYIDIPKIDCYLPIYHGTSDEVLEIGAGHFEGSSLPVGGESAHCVISGHSGLPSAKLFTDIDTLEIGDEFYLSVLGETITYEVDQILIVLPNETQELTIKEGEDYCTLVTCTPYGINSHRLLVRGKRVEQKIKYKKGE